MPKPRAMLKQTFPLIYDLLTDRLTSTLIVSAGLFALVSYSAFVMLVLGSDGLVTANSRLIGGDFVVFRTAAQLAGSDAMVPMYQIEFLSQHLRTLYPRAGSMMLGWLYPPTMLLLVTPLAGFPYLVGLGVWLGAQLALFAASIRAIWDSRTAMFLSLSAPAVLQAVITGQTAMLTGSLIALSAWFSQSRPLLAGVAAGALTIKPQFGVLIPLAFAAGRCWKAFGYASLTSVILALVAFFLYGGESWLAFGEAMRSHAVRMGTDAIPFGKLITPYGASRLLGSTPTFAIFVQLIGTVLLALYVAAVWRVTPRRELRLAALASSAPLATPYAFYYELAIFVIPVAIVALEATRTGWLRGERLSVIAVWIASFLPPGVSDTPSLPLSFFVSFAAFSVCARRILSKVGLSNCD